MGYDETPAIPRDPSSNLGNEAFPSSLAKNASAELHRNDEPAHLDISATVQARQSAVDSRPLNLATPTADYQQLLLVLAEEYVSAAHGIGYLAAFYRRHHDLHQYYNYIAMGLSCVEASLTQFRLAPEGEAHLTLHYCNMVFQETFNQAEVDKWLSKAVSPSRTSRGPRSLIWSDTFM